MTEFLSTPLYFLVYAQRRSQYFPKISVNSDNAALGFHLSQNLWLDDEFDYVNIGDDFTQDMDAAFVNRREGFKPGDTPEGILTRFKGTFFEELMEFINECEGDRAIDLGAFLLSLREEAARYLAENIQRVVDQSHKDFQNHDFSLVSDKVGLTFHCSFRSQDDAVERVIAHATLRKYKQKADKWFAVARNALNSKPFQVAAVIDEPWHFDPILEEASKSLKEYNRVPSTRPLPHAGTKKIGRNERCPCGSSKKYKFCCGV